MKRLCVGAGKGVEIGQGGRDWVSYVGTSWRRGLEYDKRKKWQSGIQAFGVSDADFLLCKGKLSRRQSLERDTTAKRLFDDEFANEMPAALQKPHEQHIETEDRNQSARLESINLEGKRIASPSSLTVRPDEERGQPYGPALPSSKDYDGKEPIAAPLGETGELMGVIGASVVEMEFELKPDGEHCSANSILPAKPIEGKESRSSPTTVVNNLPRKSPRLDVRREALTARKTSEQEKGIMFQTAPSIADGTHSILTMISTQENISQLEKNPPGVRASGPPSGILAEGPDISMSDAHSSNPTTDRQSKVKAGSRLSDDTNMLRDFLDRAKAKKAAKNAQLTENVHNTLPSPRRSPRRALNTVDGNLSPTKRSQEIANRPGTPPGDQRLGTSEFDDADEGVLEPTVVRRSARVRIPAPRKLPLGTPSLIPVRRPDGSEPIILQKSVAQELAVITRANTRRNKGQSKPVELVLQGLPLGPVESEPSRRKAREASKHVAWDETLFYHLEGKEAGDDRKKPRSRKLKGLGTANGTAATKNVPPRVASHAGTPGPKRKARSKKQDLSVSVISGPATF